MLWWELQGSMAKLAYLGDGDMVRHASYGAKSRQEEQLTGRCSSLSDIQASTS